MGRPPGFDCFVDLMDLGNQLGAKLGWKIEARQDWTRGDTVEEIN